MNINLTTPALLFPAISLLLLAYTNRFLAVAALIRNLHSKYQSQPQVRLIRQIKNLRTRTYLIRNMQVLGVLSLLLCVLAMFVLYAGFRLAGNYIFGSSLLFLLVSLALSVWEIQISVKALNIQLDDLEFKS